VIPRLLTFTLLFIGCGRAPDAQPQSEPTVETTSLFFAKGFRIEKRGGVSIVTVTNAWKPDAEPAKYVLVPKDAAVPDEFANAAVIRIPVAKYAAMSTTHLSCFDELGRLGGLVGFTDVKRVTNQKVRDGFAEGRIKPIGAGGSNSMEAVAGLGCEALFASDFEEDAPKRAETLRRLGVEVVLAADFAENHPLGRAEWIRFFAAFFDEDAKAEKLFRNQVAEYERLTKLASKVKSKPTVLLNAPFGGTWHVPGGKSHAAKLLADAGADYLWKDVDSSGSQPLQFEAVFVKAVDAEFWLNPGQFGSLADLKKEDERFEKFAAFRGGRVFNNDGKKSRDGGSDYWETGVNHPERVLADLIAALHPELLPNHSMNWYRKLP
jgi:iron complex transport system substrate-binding protein